MIFELSNIDETATLEAPCVRIPILACSKWAGLAKNVQLSRGWNMASAQMGMGIV